MLKKDEFRFRPVILLLVVFAVPNVIFLLVKGMSYYYASDSFRNESLIVKKEGIRIVFHIKEIEKLGGKDSLDKITNEIKEVLTYSKSGEFQSKLCDETDCIYTIYGTEANRLHQVLKTVLRKYPADSGYVYMLYNLKNTREQVKDDLY